MLLYDPSCGFCRAMVGLMLERDADRKIVPLTLDGPQGAELLEGIPESTRVASMWVQHEGELVGGGDALKLLARVVPTFPGRSGLLILPSPMVRGGYRVVAARRAVFVRFVPTSRRRRWEAELAARLNAV